MDVIAIITREGFAVRHTHLIRIATIALLLGAGTFDRPRAQSSVPLTVVAVQVDRANNTVRFILRNDGTKSVAAWNVDVTYLNDSVTGSKGEGGDSYWSEHLAPGNTLTRTFRVRPLSDTTPISVEIRPTAVVFEDTTTAGDPNFAQFIFKRRASDVQAWQEILESLEQARVRVGTGPEAFQIARDQLSSSNVEPSHPSKKTARDNLDLAIRDVRLGRVTSSARLNALIEDAQRRLAAAISHSRRP